MRGIFTTLTLLGMSIGVHAQSTDTQVVNVAPDSISTKILQINPENFNIEYLAPWTKKLSSTQWKKDSADLHGLLDEYNLNRNIKKFWIDIGMTPEEAYKMIIDDWKALFVDKIRLAVVDGQIKYTGPAVRPNNIPEGTVLKLGELEKRTSLEELRKWGF